ncbi:hypothetical protein L1F06_015665 [Ectopseudomonas hydrolytica]|uniref:Morphogenetic protein n=1 Tax=Ectopseudomonas hydrolytica TaxID=2493633 RepID=A0ABY5A2L7_9GAMM|nr:hypothetical protein [Pseudomonas hydrolytica]USR38108.1 hypothetical protein L1F06_015665 [Pseudomonas hydrolytica]
MEGGAVKERPILFSAAMVRAILEGRKTVTRRVVKHQPDVPVTDAIPRRNYPHGPATVDWYWRPQHGHLNGVPSNGWDFKCPYGQPGDRLWVRETWRGVVKISPPDSPMELGVARYVPDRDECFRLEYAATQVRDDEPWRPSIHMPRWASRILLEITDVRVERLQNITAQQARAEGISPLPGGRFHCGHDEEGEVTSKSPITAFAWLWNSINGEDAWAGNPWVWVVEFKRVEQSA